MGKYLITFLVIIFAGIALYYFAHLGHYPVAIVNGKLITARELGNEYTVALQYYARVLAQQKQVNLASADTQKELRRAALNDLIEKSLIAAELEKRVGGDFRALVQSRIGDQKIDGKNLTDAAKFLYGLTVEDFKKFVLVPAAEKELLDSRLNAENKKLADWLAQAEQAAQVTILTPEFSWATNKVVLRAQ